MTKIESAVAWALAVANDPTHGYAQDNRWGPDYDCSSLVITAFEQAGIPVKTRGATYTGNMRAVFLACGFKDVTNTVNRATGAGVERGDVLLNELSHTALALGGGRIVHAAGNERGGISGGTPGDQTGAEICERAYYNSPWDCVLRYVETDPAASKDGASSYTPVASPSQGEVPGANTGRRGQEYSLPAWSDAISTKTPNIHPVCPLYLPELSYGDIGEAVRAMQTLLDLRDCPCGTAGADGELGPATYAALRSFQAGASIGVDGICGEETWQELIYG